jgi:hypothetical protein
MLRVLGLVGWLGHALLGSVFLSVAVGTASREGVAELLFLAIVAAMAPTLVMMAHLPRNDELREEDRRLWRALLLWFGPIAGAAYLSVADRRLSASPIAWILRAFLD